MPLSRADSPLPHWSPPRAHLRHRWRHFQMGCLALGTPYWHWLWFVKLQSVLKLAYLHGWLLRSAKRPCNISSIPLPPAEPWGGRHLSKSLIFFQPEGIMFSANRTSVHLFFMLGKRKGVLVLLCRIGSFGFFCYSGSWEATASFCYHKSQQILQKIADQTQDQFLKFLFSFLCSCWKQLSHWCLLDSGSKKQQRGNWIRTVEYDPLTCTQAEGAEHTNQSPGLIPGLMLMELYV